MLYRSLRRKRLAMIMIAQLASLVTILPISNMFDRFAVALRRFVLLWLLKE